jgi:hypothetical protein
VGEGSTALGGGGTRATGGGSGRGGGSGGSGGDGIKSWVRGDGERAGGGRGGNGPIRSTVDDTREAVGNTVNQVQEALPVPAPDVRVPGTRPPRDDRPKR